MKVIFVTEAKTDHEFRCAEEIGNRTANLFAIDENKQFEVREFISVTEWSVFEQDDILSNKKIIHETVKKHAKLIDKGREQRKKTKS